MFVVLDAHAASKILQVPMSLLFSFFKFKRNICFKTFFLNFVLMRNQAVNHKLTHNLHYKCTENKLLMTVALCGTWMLLFLSLKRVIWQCSTKGKYEIYRFA